MLLAPSLALGQGSNPAPAGPHAAGEPRSVLYPSLMLLCLLKHSPGPGWFWWGLGIRS